MQNQPLDSPEMPKPDPMKKMGKIVGINLLILFALAIVMLIPSLGSSDPYSGMGYGIGMMMLIPAQAIVNLIIGIVFFVKRDNDLGRSYMLSMLAVAVVGTSACFGGLAMF